MATMKVTTAASLLLALSLALTVLGHGSAAFCISTRTTARTTKKLSTPDVPSSVSERTARCSFLLHATSTGGDDNDNPTRNHNDDFSTKKSSVTRMKNSKRNMEDLKLRKNNGGSDRREWLNNIISGTAIAMAGIGSGSSLSSSSPFVFSTQPAFAIDVVTEKTTTAICDPTVTIWKKRGPGGGNDDGRIIYLLGTAHVSAASAELAGKLVRDIHPTGVFVELDPKRVTGSGVLANKVSDMDNNNNDGSNDQTNKSSRVIVPNIQKLTSTNSNNNDDNVDDGAELGTDGTSNSSKKNNRKKNENNNPMMRVASMAVGSSIKKMYKNLDNAGFQSGNEFVQAIQEGQKYGADIVLGDRDVEITLRRLTEAISQTDINALLAPDEEFEAAIRAMMPNQQLEASLEAGGTDFGSDEKLKEDFSVLVEAMKEKENVKAIMYQLQRTAPAIYDAMVGERDVYMSAGLNGLNELQTIVAVMGLAHVDGVERNLKANGWIPVSPMCKLNTKKRT